MRRSGLRTFERDAYKVSRAAGDLEAVERGGAPRLARRLVRRKITRSILSRIWGR